MITNAVNRNDDVGGEGFVEGAVEEGDHGKRMKDEGGRMKGGMGKLHREEGPRAAGFPFSLSAKKAYRRTFGGWFLNHGFLGLHGLHGFFWEDQSVKSMKSAQSVVKTSGVPGRRVHPLRHILHPSSLILAIAALLLALSLPGRGGESADEKSWRVWLEPRSSHAAVTLPIAGAERTELCAGFMEEAGPRAMSRAELAAMGIGMAQFAARARENVAADLATLKPRYTRNRKGVIEYAELHSERPVVAGAMLAPKFLALFKDTLGEKVLVVVPNRFTAYVFPALSGNHADYAPMVFAALRATAWPVSVEVFEVSAEGVRCVGRYAEP